MEENRKCAICGSDQWRILHAGDESNCECEGECLRVCDGADDCDGVAELNPEPHGTAESGLPEGDRG